MSEATVIVDGQAYSGRVYHVRENGWPCVKTPNGHVASGPRLENLAATWAAQTGRPINALGLVVKP